VSVTHLHRRNMEGVRHTLDAGPVVVAATASCVCLQQLCWFMSSVAAQGATHCCQLLALKPKALTSLELYSSSVSTHPVAAAATLLL
jgi:hypothetical protein